MCEGNRWAGVGWWTVVMAVLVTAAFCRPALAQERIAIGWSGVSDGSCSVQQRTLTGEYGRTSDAMTVRGRVRTAPAGGDCRTDTFSYDVRVARYFSAGPIDATVEFSAVEESVGAPYDLAGDHGILLRADGNPLFSTTLPAGRAQTIVAAVGMTRAMGPVRVGGLVNLAPVDWQDHAPGRTVRGTLDVGHRGAYLELQADVGAEHFGQVSTGYRYSPGESNLELGGGVVHRWGLSAIDNGAPLSQLVNGSPFLRAGPPQDTSTAVMLTVGYRIGG